MNKKDSKLAHGTVGSPQESIENQEYPKAAEEADKNNSASDEVLEKKSSNGAIINESSLKRDPCPVELRRFRYPDPDNIIDRDGWEAYYIACGLKRSPVIAVRKINNTLHDHLKATDWIGVEKEFQGITIVDKEGNICNHISEMRSSYISLKKHVKTLKGSLKNPYLEKMQREVIQVAVDICDYYIPHIEEIFRKYGETL
ncbi:MAG: polymorphic toxin type 28 domain-containing protein [Clostridia bacterium]|nr:polymorphic toxin type 28 domain-containing protein [Clostridia bacterium]